MAPLDAIWLNLVKTWPLPATSWLPAHPLTLQPYRGATGIGYASKIYLKWQEI